MRRAGGLLLAAIAVIALSGVIAANWRFANGLDAFRVDARGFKQRILADEMDRAGGAADVLLLRVASTEDVDTETRALRAALAALPAVKLAAAGPSPSLLGATDMLYRYRYLLSDRVGNGLLEVDDLRSALTRLAADLRRPVPQVDEARAAADPTGEFAYLLEQWFGGASAPDDDGGWHTAEGDGIIVLLPRAATYDLDAQTRLLDTIQQTAADAAPAATVTITGAPAVAVAVRDAIRDDVRRLSLIAGLGILVLLLATLRRPRALLYAILPAAAGGLTATAAVLLVFGEIHGVTLGFGAMLLGVTVDYPLHLLGFAGRSGTDLATARNAIRRPLLVGALSSAVGLLALGLSGVGGLQQLAVFAASGIAGALLATTRVVPLLPWPSPRPLPPAANAGRSPGRHQRAFGSIVALLLSAVCLGGGTWSLTQLHTDSDLTGLSPLPPRLIALDGQLRASLGLPEPRYLIALQGRQEAVLAATEQLTQRLAALEPKGAFARYRAISDVIPAAATQRARRASLPRPAVLRQRLRTASDGLGLNPGAFTPFVEAIATSRELAWLQPDAVDDGLVGAWLGGLMHERGAGWVSLIRFSGVANWPPIAALAETADGADVRATALDARAATEGMVSAYQATALKYSLLGGALMLALVLAGSGNLVIAGRALVVVGAGLGASLLLLAVLDRALTLFHLCSLLLVAGLALDYALFTADAGGRRTTAVCAASSVIAFGALASASTPVLHGIGTTVVSGVAAAWLVAALLPSAPPPQSGTYG